MKKIALFVGALLIAGSSFACEGKCCKGKKENCSKEKKEACAKGKGCCKKGESKDASASSTTNGQSTTNSNSNTAAPTK